MVTCAYGVLLWPIGTSEIQFNSNLKKIIEAISTTQYVCHKNLAFFQIKLETCNLRTYIYIYIMVGANVTFLCVYSIITEKCGRNIQI